MRTDGVAKGLPAVAYSRAGERPTTVAKAPSRARRARRGAGRLVLHPPPRQAYAQAAWQMLADAARLGVIRDGRPEAWAAGAVVALARVSGRLGADAALTAQQVADELDVTLGTLAVIERELARVLNLARYARRLPVGRA